jgi:putative transposase
LVLVTRHRRGVLDDTTLKRCEETTRKVRAGFETEPRESTGEADHVHPLARYPPKTALSKPINSLKGVGSRYPRAEYTGQINRIGTGSSPGPAPTSRVPARARR